MNWYEVLIKGFVVEWGFPPCLGIKQKVGKFRFVFLGLYNTLVIIIEIEVEHSLSIKKKHNCAILPPSLGG